MFELKISGVHEAQNLIGREEWPDKTVSLLDPARSNHWFNPSEKLHAEFFDDVSVLFEDEAAPAPSDDVTDYALEETKKRGYKVPTKEMVGRVLDFTKNIKPTDKVLIHCHAGISRSTATAIAAAVQHGLSPERAIKWVEEIRPQMFPNALIIKYADEILEQNGALWDAYEKWRTSVQGVFFTPPTVTNADVSEMERIKNLLKGLE